MGHLDRVRRKMLVTEIVLYTVRIAERNKLQHFVVILSIHTKNIRTEKIFFKKTLFLKNKYYLGRNDSSNWYRIDINTMISI